MAASVPGSGRFTSRCSNPAIPRGGVTPLQKAGQQLSGARITNVLQVFKTIWDDDVAEHHWQLPYPLAERKKVLPKNKKKPIQVFRFTEWETIMEVMDEYYRPWQSS